MPCYKPLQAWRSRTRGKDGKLGVTFKTSEAYLDMPLQLPCGQCLGCRLERSRQWAMRAVYESQLHSENCFVTLTYDDDNLPAFNSLHKPDFQKFLKRLRRRLGRRKVRYFYCGEYGDQFGRPHYHAIFFGVDFPDKELFSDKDSGKVYTSRFLSDTWGLGFCTIGAVTFESCAYVARYVMKKVTGDRAILHYGMPDMDTGEIVQVRLPEYVNMSLKPAIGKRWYEKFSSDVYPSDFLVVRGVKVRPPKYFDKLLKDSQPTLLESLKLRRISRAAKFKNDNTPSRLKVRERVAAAQLNQLKRHKEFT